MTRSFYRKSFGGFHKIVLSNNKSVYRGKVAHIWIFSDRVKVRPTLKVVVVVVNSLARPCFGYTMTLEA